MTPLAHPADGAGTTDLSAVVVRPIPRVGQAEQAGHTGLHLPDSAKMPRTPRDPFTIAFLLLLLVVMLVASRDFGVTWDEELQQRRGEQIAAFYTDGSADLIVREDGAHLYGAPFDVLAVGLQRLVSWDTYVVRHLLNALIGWLGIAFCGLLAHRLFGSWTALLAIILLASLPRYIGHSMNNIKDIPFATLATAVLYMLTRLSNSYPYLNFRNAVGLTVVLGLALNVRPGALLFLAYLVVPLGYRLVQTDRIGRGHLIMTGVRAVAISAAVLLVGSLFWPWALERPIVGPFLGLAHVSRFGWDHSMLFAGTDVQSFAPRWDYVPRWLLLTTPLVLIAGVVLSLPLLAIPRAQPQTAALWGVVLFPVVYVIGVRAVMFDGIRHLLFIQPPLAILSAAGWVWGTTHGPRWRRSLAGVTLVAGLVPPISFIVREHPNQVVYFNEAAGGPVGAYGRYEMDYWGNCLLQGLVHADQLTPDGRRSTVSGWPLHILEANASRFPRLTIAAPELAAHHFEVVLARGSRADVLNLARRDDFVARVQTTDGALLCTVLPGPRHRDLQSDYHATTRARAKAQAKPE